MPRQKTGPYVRLTPKEYWQIGKVILEEEQEGKERAGYGEFLIKSLSETLQPHFGSGFSIRQLEMCRQFYRSFPITNELRSQFSWTHYRTLHTH